MMENNTSLYIRPNIQSNTTLILCVLSVLFCKLIALIFFVLAYTKYENANDLWLTKSYEASILAASEAKSDMVIGIWIAIICIILEIIIVTAIIVGLIGILST